MFIVQKYGGTSVGSVERIQAVAQRVLATVSEGHNVAVIVSAMAGETNRLTTLAGAMGGTRNHREMDVLLATGEQVSVALLSMAINAAGGEAVSFLGHQIRMQTDSAFSRARIRAIDARALHGALSNGKVPIIAGFQGQDAEGNITTLGRGGSDTSAVAVAASLQADPNFDDDVCCEIYTDVKGVFTTDPNICSEARLIKRITFDEMMELASLGAKVLQIRSVELASKYRVALHVRSSFTQEGGTMVVHDDEGFEKVVVTGVSLDRDQARITVRDLPLAPGTQADLFGPLGELGVVVDMIVQNPPLDGRTNLSFTLPRTALSQTLELLEPLMAKLGAKTRSDDDVCKVSIVGVGMRSHAGVAQKMFSVLAKEGVEILMISTSEIKVSCIVALRYGELAVRALHAAFELGVG
ncbi:MAG: aspartate kinase [Deltaproteobacteria bacterium]|nr:aspartate kinase [Deltaproteobacteria bacterium]